PCRWSEAQSTWHRFPALSGAFSVFHGKMPLLPHLPGEYPDKGSSRSPRNSPDRSRRADSPCWAAVLSSTSGTSFSAEWFMQVRKDRPCLKPCPQVKSSSELLHRHISHCQGKRIQRHISHILSASSGIPGAAGSVPMKIFHLLSFPSDSFFPTSI